jgi:hypothetical protein
MLNAKPGGRLSRYAMLLVLLCDDSPRHAPSMTAAASERAVKCHFLLRSSCYVRFPHARAFSSEKPGSPLIAKDYWICIPISIDLLVQLFAKLIGIAPIEKSLCSI